MAKKRKNKRMRKRRWFTATERVEVWDRWQRGESSQSIGRVLDRGGSTIHRQLALYGGIRPQSRCRSSRALTLVERHSRYVMLTKVPNKKTETVVNALIELAHQLPTQLYKSLTWDRGLEMADHKRFTLATNIAVYFCDPRSPWQRGSNENTNALLRYYFPKRTNLSLHSQEHLDAVARQLNERPRKTLEFATPAETFNACVASTG